MSTTPFDSYIVYIGTPSFFLVLRLKAVILGEVCTAYAEFAVYHLTMTPSCRSLCLCVLSETYRSISHGTQVTLGKANRPPDILGKILEVVLQLSQAIKRYVSHSY